MIEKQLPGFKPLCFLKGELYLYRRGSLYVLLKDVPEKLFRIYPETWKEMTRLTARFFRCEPKYAVSMDDESMLVVGRKRILKISITDQKAEEITAVREGFSEPLNLCKARKNWKAIWGDYGPNANRLGIRIYGLTNEMTVQTIYSFDPGQIRHLHNIIPIKSGGYYLFTGDQEPGAGIYKADANFHKVEPVATGKQQYRAVVGFDTPQGLLYATDAVNENNYIYLLKPGKEPEVICPLNGSCIYGIKHKKSYYCSTTVEPDENNRGLLSWVSKKRGKGILSDMVHLVEVDEKMNGKVVMKLEKDFWPMKLMQYGSIQFPRGDGADLWIYPVGVRNHDGAAIRTRVK